MGQNITNEQPPNPQSLWNSKGPHVDAVLWKVKRMDLYQAVMGNFTKKWLSRN